MSPSSINFNLLVVASAALLVAYLGQSTHALPPPMLRTACGFVADAEEAVNNHAAAAGKAVGEMVLKPIAIVGGLKAAAVGAGMKAGGGAIRYVGEKLTKDGSILESTGAGVKGAGLGVASMGLRPVAEKIVEKGKKAEDSLNAASAAASSFAKSVGDTSIQIDARLDSPILGHHHKNVNVTAGMETAMNQVDELKGKFKKGDGVEGGEADLKTAQQAVEQVTQQQEAVKQTDAPQQLERTKRAAKIDPEVMKLTFGLVKETKLEDCVARAVCDLNCNPQGFGQDGKQVFMNMVRLQGSNVLEQGDSNYYKEAAQKGRTYSGKCEQCATHYKNCTHPSSDLIKIASHIKMD